MLKMLRMAESLYVVFLCIRGADCGFSCLLIKMPAHSGSTTYMCDVFVVLLHHIILPQGAVSGTGERECH